MELKIISKIEELDKYKWEYKKHKFRLEQDRDMFSLYEENYMNHEGEISKTLFIQFISTKNISNLKLYGLKVKFGKTPKLNLKDKLFLEREIYYARDEDGMLFQYDEKPCRDDSDFWIKMANTNCTKLPGEILNFITWESGKVWTKTELMQLEIEKSYDIVPELFIDCVID